ncbi:TetR/AcrR family transcriptional regulator [Kineosporia sp. A_224]|uniref:TetR/AcrR family transcriptional regulator n=1 Tax=Kineosporia sp. A_224 TaxID=1962180 RepID=UPI000B4BCFEC|nr:TetR/AcrR family transcriptional regulator [Kineosporia sp. A_224]
MPDVAADRRVRRTRAAIQRALLTLMAEKGYEAVTATDIIERADIGRSTFYTHFSDKQHVLYDSLDDLGDFLRDQRPGHDGVLGFGLALFEHVDEQRDLVRVLLGRRGGHVVQDRVAHLLAELVREDLAPLAAAAPDVPLDLVVTGVVGTYLALLRTWADSGTTWTPAEMDDAARRLLAPGLAALLAPVTA